MKRSHRESIYLFCSLKSYRFALTVEFGLSEQSLPDMAPTNCHFLTEQFRTNLVTDCNFQV